MAAITCAFCKGKGLDPFELLSSLSKCQVCLGRGKVAVKGPTVKCAYCKGTGVHPYGVRLVCTVCGGKGVVTVKEPTIICPDCNGNGRALESGLSCLTCKGKGVIAAKTALSRKRISISKRKLRN